MKQEEYGIAECWNPVTLCRPAASPPSSLHNMAKKKLKMQDNDDDGGAEEEEPDFSDPEDYVDSITDEGECGGGGLGGAKRRGTSTGMGGTAG